MNSPTIQEVKTAWEERLMAIPGVMGVGIGLTKQGKHKCIKVYVNRQQFLTTPAIPQEIEGYPVEVETRGAFRAL